MKIALALCALTALVAGDALKELQTKLGSGDARERRSAVEGLAKLDSDEAWKLVIDVLDDPFPQVADEAQIQIAKIDDAPSLELLLGKDGLQSKDAWVRVRVVEALGRMAQASEVSALIAPLRDKSPDVRRAAAWTLERLKRADKLGGDLARNAILATAAQGAADKEKEPEVRAALVVAEQVLSVRDPKRLASYASDKEPAVRSAALIAARDAPQDEALALAGRLANDADLGVRINCAETLAARKCKPAAQALVGQFGVEKELAGRWRMLALLREMSGQKTGMNADTWRAWADSLPADWTGGEAPKESAGDDERTTAAFAGLALRSGRVAFLIDLSGSVWEQGKKGKTKKQVIDAELSKALESLPAGTRFNVIPYTDTPIPWQKSLVTADKKNVAKAIEAFVDCRENGKGNFWDALSVALEDPEVDSVVVLTDGAPTGGRRWNLELMKELFAEKNRFRRVVLDAILVEPREPLRKPWAEMCASSGGRVVEFEL